jgi:hypothetical protein
VPLTDSALTVEFTIPIDETLDNPPEDEPAPIPEPDPVAFASMIALLIKMEATLESASNSSPDPIPAIPLAETRPPEMFIDPTFDDS